MNSASSKQMARSYNAIKYPHPNVGSIDPFHYEGDDSVVAGKFANREARPLSDRRPEYAVSTPEPELAERANTVSAGLQTRSWPTGDVELVHATSTPETVFPRDHSPSQSSAHKELMNNRKGSYESQKPYDPHAEVRKAQAAERGCLGGARDVYKAGPLGEGQKFWRGVQQLHWKRRARAQTYAQRPHDHMPDSRTTRSRDGYTQRPLPPLPLALDRLYDLTSFAHTSVSTWSDSPGKGQGSAYGDIADAGSPSSLDLQVGASASVQYDASPWSPLFRRKQIDVSKPLPSTPTLKFAPRRVKGATDKELPSTPPIPPLPSSNDTVSNVSHTLTAPKEFPFPTTSDREELWPNGKNKKGDKAIADSWRARLLKASTHLLDITETNTTDLKRQEELKAKISHPKPLLRTDPSSVNIAPESGGVGGPGAARSLPIRNGLPTRPNQHKETKKAAPAWSDRPAYDANREISLTPPYDPRPPAHEEVASKLFQRPQETSRRKRSSELSFTCQGLASSQVTPYAVMSPYSADTRDQDTHVANPAPREWSRSPLRCRYPSAQDKCRVPFSASTGWSENRSAGEVRGSARDTRFYQPYDDVLQEYRS